MRVYCRLYVAAFRAHQASIVLTLHSWSSADELVGILAERASHSEGFFELQAGVIVSRCNFITTYGDIFLRNRQGCIENWIVKFPEYRVAHSNAIRKMEEYNSFALVEIKQSCRLELFGLTMNTKFPNIPTLRICGANLHAMKVDDYI